MNKHLIPDKIGQQLVTNLIFLNNSNVKGSSYQFAIITNMMGYDGLEITHISSSEIWVMKAKNKYFGPLCKMPCVSENKNAHLHRET